jgi:hypothetical protein
MLDFILDVTFWADHAKPSTMLKKSAFACCPGFPENNVTYYLYPLPTSLIFYGIGH